MGANVNMLYMLSWDDISYHEMIFDYYNICFNEHWNIYYRHLWDNRKEHDQITFDTDITCVWADGANI